MTSLSNYIKFTLNIEADNLEFLDASLEKYRGRDAKVYHAVLHLNHCLVCGSDHIWHNGHSYSKVRCLALDASLPVFIRIAKERVVCQDCHRNSMAETDLVNKHWHISNPVKRKIISALTEDRSMKGIAIQNSVSTCTVQRLLEKYQTAPIQNYDWLPEHLAFDEFRGVGRQLHFIAIDGQSHHVIKILPNRLKNSIVKYFKHFPITVRQKVKTVTMDLNYYYDIMAKELFPNAQIILDRFHIVQMLNRSFNSCRIHVMKQHRKGSREYNLLKYYWKLYLKPFDDLEKTKPHYEWHLKDTLTQEQIMTEGLDLSDELENTYTLLQDISKALKNKHVSTLKKILNCKEPVGYQMRITLKTFKRSLCDLLNAARFTESNGCLEGINRKIKQIERTAYGYSNFYHLVTRIKLEEKDAILKEKASSYYQIA